MFRKLLIVCVLWTALSGVAHAASDQWIEVRSSHFIVLTNSNEKQARRVLDQFERMRWVFQTLFPKTNADPPTPILVYAAKNGKTFQAIEPAPYLAKGQLSLAGYFLSGQDGNYILLRLDAEQQHPFATVYHEYTHLQFRSSGEWMPLWLNEGIAEFFQNTEVLDKEMMVGEPSPGDILYLRQHSLIPLRVLFKVDASSPYYHQEQKGSVFYAESWALTHYLMVTNHEKKTDSLSAYMTLMSHHEDPVIAAGKAFGDIDQLQSALESYIRAGQYQQFVVRSAAAPIDGSTYTVRPVTEIEAEVNRAKVLSLVQREKESRDLIDAILKTDPNNALALETMGGIELRAGNPEAARKWFGQAVKLNSKSFLSNYYYAAISMQSPGASHDPEIEQGLRAAIQLNPKFAPAYDKLAVFFGMQRQNLTEALSLITDAVRLEPGNPYYRLDAANVLAELDRYSEAFGVLQAAAKLSRNPRELALVQSSVDRLKQMQQAQAQAENARRDFQAQQSQASAPQTLHVFAVPDAPKYPAEAKGPKHSFVGIMHAVKCSYPTVLEFRVDGATSSVKVYSNDFSKLDLTVVGFAPKGPMSPCSDFDGLKARVQYAETTDKRVDGQVFAIELRK